MLNSIPNHFSYLFENKNAQIVNKRKTITKSKEETSKSISRKKKTNEVFAEKDLKKEELGGSDFASSNNAQLASGYGKQSASQAFYISESYKQYSQQQLEERSSLFSQSKMELDAAPLNYQQDYSAGDSFPLQKKLSFIQQEEMDEFDSFDDVSQQKKQNLASVNANYEVKQFIPSAHYQQGQQINQERREEAFGCKAKTINENAIPGLYQAASQPSLQQPTEMIFWRRANQLQTKFSTKLRPHIDCNQILLSGDLCMEIVQDDYNSYLASVPLSAYKRISNIKKYHEGKVEVQLITDVQLCQDILFAKKENEDEQVQQNTLQNASSSSSFESQIKQYQARVDQKKQLFSQIKQQSSSIFDNLRDHVNMKKQQFLNKIDFERKYIFAIEFQLDESDGVSNIGKVYYSKEFLSIMGLASKDPALLEAYLLKCGVIDLHDCLGLYNKKNENKGDLISHYLQPLTESQKTLKTLDNLQVKNVSVNHRIVNLSEEFTQMFADIGLQNISQEYFILYELDIPYDQIKQIESERKQVDKGVVPYFFDKNLIPNHLLSKYYSLSQNQSSSA